MAVKKAVKEEVVEEVKVTEVKVQETKAEVENKQLRSEVDTLKDLVSQLMAQMQNTAPAATTLESVVDELDISPNKYVKVMSLRNHVLNLSTEGFGRGKPYKFTKYGQIRNISYEDVSAIINAEESFHRKGAFIILDDIVVKKNGIEELQAGILTAEEINTLFDMDATEVGTIFGSASDMQKETIVSLLITRAVNGEDLDYNKLRLMSKNYHTDIAKMIDEILNPVEQS